MYVKPCGCLLPSQVDTGKTYGCSNPIQVHIGKIFGCSGTVRIQVQIEKIWLLILDSSANGQTYGFSLPIQLQIDGGTAIYSFSSWLSKAERKTN